ncbi:MAG: hypothetical protein M1837_000981 [Sclerophora amabilis]|nr:MAG: hypothetical protein M1837_000981 [Sclerophora amabilis]
MEFSSPLFNRGGSSERGEPNDTSSTRMSQVPVNLLESFIPGYSIISRYLLEAFGFDITILVSVCFLTFAVGKCGKYIWRNAYDIFQDWFTSSISIPENDMIYDYMMGWLADQKVSKDSRSLQAKTSHSKVWDDEEDAGDENPSDDSNLEDDDHDPEEGDLTKIVNFSNWDAKTPPRYEPALGDHHFWHKGNYFLLNRAMKQVMSTSYGSSAFQDTENLTLTCVGRSPQPIKSLLEEARDHFLEKEKVMTVIRRPGSKEMRQMHGGHYLWDRVATRPSRPMDTVVLDHAQKESLLADINEYLHPATARWYANRGIPLRRGYLFFGPPGTGKSSLSFALAGIFGLDIYVISLLEPSLSEEDLGLLFNDLPRRCIVLLEDIDSAGLKRKEKKEVDDKETPPPTSSEWGLTEVAKALQSAKADEADEGKKKGISLSGLLNAIDGVASHEGRVLVMTTNFPEQLDEALIRPGRIDMQVRFSLATKMQAKELFVRMYSSSGGGAAKVDDGGSSGQDSFEEKAALNRGRRQNGNTNDNNILNGHTEKPPTRRLTSSRSLLSIPLHELRQIGDEFAALIPSAKLSPAEIQGFLLMRKRDPRKALADAPKWRDALIAAKAAKKKVVDVQ